jgi:hypothetical protein
VRNKYPKKNKGSGVDNDSIWSLVAGVAKNFPQLKFNEILFDLSYSNLVLYSAVLPTYEDDNGDIDADDPRNKHLIRSMLYD